jgi:dTDP-4-dehydrorhamnose 3,5-epimerase
LIFHPTPIAGAHLIEIERMSDDRGFFARTWCREEFAHHGIAVDMVQTSVSQNRLAGTLRGMHFAWPPSREAKLVRCESGRVHDIILDLRPASPTFLQHFGINLDDELRNALFIPSGVAHGFQTLVDECTVYYMMTDFFRPELADGVRFDDRVFNIEWPLPVTSIHQRDRSYADFDPKSYALRYHLATERDGKQ